MNLTLNFNGITKTLTPIDVRGKVMYDLNEIRREWGLPENKQPSQWRGKERDVLGMTANLQAFQIPGKKGSASVVATQTAVYAYAMWVSTDFFMAVVQCFTHVVNGDIEQAVRRSTGERAPDHMGRECRIIGNRVAC